MAHHKSAKKRIRQNARIRAHNRHVRTGMRTVVKRFRQAVESGDTEAAREGLQKAEIALRKAASKGIIPRRRASRLVGRLARRYNALAEGSAGS